MFIGTVPLVVVIEKILMDNGLMDLLAFKVVKQTMSSKTILCGFFVVVVLVVVVLVLVVVVVVVIVVNVAAAAGFVTKLQLVVNEANAQLSSFP